MGRTHKCQHFSPHRAKEEVEDRFGQYLICENADEKRHHYRPKVHWKTESYMTRSTKVKEIVLELTKSKQSNGLIRERCE
ncbi:Protein Daple [Manis pentadactyla]|nr:Protein Daple [Manis pentadactyla]